MPLHIIKAKPCISSIPKEWYLIKPQAEYTSSPDFGLLVMIYTLTRDDIRRTRAAMIYTHFGA